MSNSYRYIRDLRPDITDKWRINVMVARKWTSSNPTTGRIFSEDFIFVDEQGSSIHAKVPINLRNKYRNLVKEGCIYKIHKFKVLAYSMLYRPLTREFYVEFSASTFVQSSTIRQQLFPRYVFDFVPFDKLAARIDDDTYLTDVIGVLREWGPLDNKDGSESRQRNLRNIVIVDTGDVKLNISLWGECALKFTDDLIESKKDTNIVVVLAGCRVRKFGAFPQVTTTVASQFFLNPGIIQVANYSQRPIHPVLVKSTDIECEELIVTSVPDIYMRMVDGVDVGTKFIIEATVIGFDLSRGWNYLQCTTCYKTVEFRDFRYYCTHCKRNSTPRQAYKLVVQVYNNKEMMECVVFNDNAIKLLGCTVDELIAKDSQEGAGDPNWILDFFIESLFGVPVVFGIKVDEYNLKPRFSRRFTVSTYYGNEFGVLNHVNATKSRVLPPLLPVIANPLSTLEYEMQTKVTEFEEEMMDEIQWGPRVTSSTIKDAPNMVSNGTNEEPSNNIGECNMINNATMEGENSNVGGTVEDVDNIIINDGGNSMVEDTLEVGVSNDNLGKNT